MLLAWIALTCMNGWLIRKDSHTVPIKTEAFGYRLSLRLSRSIYATSAATTRSSKKLYLWFCSKIQIQFNYYLYFIYIFIIYNTHKMKDGNTKYIQLKTGEYFLATNIHSCDLPLSLQ